MAITETELKVIAALAMIGLSSKPEERVEHAGGNRNSHGVVERTRKTRFWRMLRMVARLRVRARDDAAQVAVEQRDARAFHGDVGARAHGDADVGLRQRGRVVHAVAGHGDDVAFGLQLLDDFAFLVGQHAGVHFVDAEFARDGFGCGAAVSGEHHDADFLAVQRSIASGVVAFTGIGDGDQPGGFPSTATNITVWPSASSDFARFVERAECECRVRRKERDFRARRFGRPRSP